MRYDNRLDAAQQLLPSLEKYRNQDCVVLAIPRGGVPIGYVIAKHFEFNMDLLMIKKIGHPGNPEFAIGAVTLEDYIVDTHKATISGEYIAAQIQKIRQKLERQYNHFTGTRKPIELANKTIIVIDDGIATGNTILAAIRILRRHQPARIVVAVPVAPTETARRIRREVDEFICPYIPDTFYGVGYYYNDFNQVSDAEVIHLLADMTPTINHPT